jgi:hypothetical protein
MQLMQKALQSILLIDYLLQNDPIHLSVFEKCENPIGVPLMFC